jgi:hypothetical protein
MRLSGQRFEQRETCNGCRSWSVTAMNPGGNQVAAFGSDPLSLPGLRCRIPRQNGAIRLSQQT